MENFGRSCLSLFLLPFSLFSLLILAANPSFGQQRGASYEFSFRPDLWYNDVDGIQIGTRMSGRMRGTGEEGPHRLDASLLLGTWFPSNPFSWSVLWTEPIPSLSPFESEFNIQLLASAGEGIQSHGVSVNKRWQDPFDFRSYRELSLGYRLQERYDEEYALFPQLWSSGWKGLIQPEFHLQQQTPTGPYQLILSGQINTLDSFFYTVDAAVTRQFRLGGDWQLRSRLYFGHAGDDAPVEYLHFRSSGPEIGRLESRLTRAKGTVPVPWARSGTIHHAGGANIRGYTGQDIASAVALDPLLFRTVGALNLELDIPNPVQRMIRNQPYASEFVSLRTYLFTDGAVARGWGGPGGNGGPGGSDGSGGSGGPGGAGGSDGDPGAGGPGGSGGSGGGGSGGSVDGPGGGQGGSGSTGGGIGTRRNMADAGAGVAFSLNIPDHLGRHRGFVIRYEVPFWLSDPGSEPVWKWRHLVGFGATIHF